MALSTKIEGPTRVIPPTPHTYWSCINCVHYYTQRKTTIDPGNGYSGHKVCHHPQMVVNKTLSLDTNENLESEEKTVAPECCPFLQKEKE